MKSEERPNVPEVPYDVTKKGVSQRKFCEVVVLRKLHFYSLPPARARAIEPSGSFYTGRGKNYVCKTAETALAK